MRSLSVLLFSAGLASAWLPGVHKDISNTTGHNLFRRENPTGRRWLPGSNPNPQNKIRGVDLGSLFVFEPWMAHDLWEDMGCTCPSEGDCYSEFDCVNQLGQSQANTVFQNHWNTWYSQSDFQTMASYGLNTVRIPVGYWLDESLVYSSEHFPQGGLQYLQQICQWAGDQGFYIIIDLHGAPYSQSPSPNADTGQYRDPGFYGSSDAYSRAETFLGWLATQIHSSSSMANVGMIEIINEPIQDESEVDDMFTNYYPNAWNAIRNAESALGISSNNQLHIQMMSSQWNGGNPDQGLSGIDTSFAAYDDHRYIKYAGVADEQSAYLETSCTDDRGDMSPTIVGEWSLSTNNNEWDPSSNMQFYNNWYAAQVLSYEKYTLGWIFWAWKTSGLNDPRWDYQMAVQQGLIPSDPDTVYSNTICDNY